MHTMPVAPRSARSRKHLLEGAGRRRRGLGERVGVLEPLPELVGAQLDPVDELLAPEADGERHDLDAQCFDERRGKVARAVGDHSYPHGPDAIGRGDARRPSVRSTRPSARYRRPRARARARRARRAPRAGTAATRPRYAADADDASERRGRERLAGRRPADRIGDQPATTATAAPGDEALRRAWSRARGRRCRRAAGRRPPRATTAPTKYAIENASASPGTPSHA